jgi:hypothetical protein
LKAVIHDQHVVASIGGVVDLNALPSTAVCADLLQADEEFCVLRCLGRDA